MTFKQCKTATHKNYNDQQERKKCVSVSMHLLSHTLGTTTYRHGNVYKKYTVHLQ